MYPYGEFLTKFDQKHVAMTHRNSMRNTRCAVILETRPLFFLPKVIRNVMFFLGSRWNLHVFGSQRSLDFLKESLPGWVFSSVEVVPQRGFTAADYNALLLSPGFWNVLREERVLVFQSDSLLTGSNIDDFDEYDYVGAPCGTADEREYIGNGGLSLRTRRTMLDCLARFTPEPHEAEDAFFSRAVRKTGAAMPDMRTASLFSVESVYTSHPVGVHGTDKFFHSVEVAERITGAVRC